MSAPGEEVFFEFQHLGPVTKVTAIDAATGLEVAIQGPTAYPPALLKKNALAKLRYVLSKNKTGTT